MHERDMSFLQRGFFKVFKADFREAPLHKFIVQYTTVGRPIIIFGDLNFHLDVQENNDTRKFTSCLKASGMLQLVNKPKHTAGHTLDVLMTRESENNVLNINVMDPGLSDATGLVSNDHFAVIFYVSASKEFPIRKTVSYGKFRSIDIEAFLEDIRNS